MTSLPLLLAGATFLIGAPAFAHNGAASAPGAAAARVVAMSMHDSMRFAPERVSVRRGEPVRLELVNEGLVMHELVVGTPEEIAQHRVHMLHDPQRAHEGANMAHVAPGERASMLWQFARSGVLEYACLLPGHYEAGMRGSVIVTD